MGSHSLEQPIIIIDASSRRNERVSGAGINNQLAAMVFEAAKVGVGGIEDVGKLLACDPSFREERWVPRSIELFDLPARVVVNEVPIGARREAQFARCVAIGV